MPMCVSQKVLLSLQIMKSDQMNTFVNMSQQYGPNIAQQAMATVSSSFLHPFLHAQFDNTI